MQPPKIIRGVHVTMALASIPGKLDEYTALRGLNTIQLDVKDENGEIGFVPSSVPARQPDRRREALPYKPRVVAKKIHDKGLYLVGRVVVMEDPLSLQRPDLAIRTTSGGRWLNHAGLGWSNPYDQRVWKYNVDIAEAVARTGFDEIQFDYVRFPSDGDMSAVVFPGKTSTPARLGDRRVRPLRLEAAEAARRAGLGRRLRLSATRDLGIGQLPRASAGTSTRSTRWSTRRTSGPASTTSTTRTRTPARLSPTRSATSTASSPRPRASGSSRVLQDFSWNRTYTLADIQAQIDSARRAKASRLPALERGRSLHAGGRRAGALGGRTSPSG